MASSNGPPGHLGILVVGKMEVGTPNKGEEKVKMFQRGLLTAVGKREIS